VNARGVSWIKLPIVGMPGTECGKMLLDGARTEVVQSFKDEFGPCDEAARWMVGDLFVCQEHAAKVAADFGDDIVAIEAAVLEECR
jgi:hypothetical protein